MFLKTMKAKNLYKWNHHYKKQHCGKSHVCLEVEEKVAGNIWNMKFEISTYSWLTLLCFSWATALGYPEVFEVETQSYYSKCG